MWCGVATFGWAYCGLVGVANFDLLRSDGKLMASSAAPSAPDDGGFLRIPLL
jgi:hypothetical protein